MYKDKTKILVGALAALVATTPAAFAFTSGSTGADGAFNPTVNTELPLPPGGIFNFTSVNIPAGVAVTFKKNAINTPVVILASGDVTIAGTLGVGAISSSPNVGAAGDGNVGDDGIPGKGGPGGYDGGAGGAENYGRGGDGLGPGSGVGGDIFIDPWGTQYLQGGGGGGFGSNGGQNITTDGWGRTYYYTGAGGATYGSSLMLPLVGGSGGGGAKGGSLFKGSGGGGGGGAILIASSGTVSITGGIYANGASSGASAGAGGGATGGGGSGGAIRIVATTISGNGALSATGGGSGAAPSNYPGGNPQQGSGGGAGRIRLESEIITRTAASTPGHSFGAPGPVFVAGLPTLRIASVAGVATPAEPTGNADITLPTTTANPVTVVLDTTGVPVGNTVKLTVTPANAAPTTVISPALTGTTANATASVQVNLPGGPSVLQAVTTYTIVASLGDILGNQYAKGERVEKIEVAATMSGGSTATLITVSGKRYPMTGPIPAIPVAG